LIFGVFFSAVDDAFERGVLVFMRTGPSICVWTPVKGLSCGAVLLAKADEQDITQLSKNWVEREVASVSPMALF